MNKLEKVASIIDYHLSQHYGYDQAAYNQAAETHLLRMAVDLVAVIDQRHAKGWHFETFLVDVISLGSSPCHNMYTGQAVANLVFDMMSQHHKLSQRFFNHEYDDKPITSQAHYLAQRGYLVDMFADLLFIEIKKLNGIIESANT